jgi:hypothetical protein
MNSLNDPVKILARRFVSLPSQVRMEVAGRALRWREEHEVLQEGEERRVHGRRARRKSFLERFWAEVEAAHGDGLYPTNPFAEEVPTMLYGAGNHSEQFLMHLSC